MEKIKVGLIGIGGMGRMHFNCYRNNKQAEIVAICDVDERKRNGDWSSIGLNIDTSKTDLVDLSGIKVYSDAEDLIADPQVQLVDVCLPTPLHARVSIAALRAGKDVLCEKPMAMNAHECLSMEEAAHESGRQLAIGHCLRYWPQYVQAQQIMQSGEFGKVLYARFHRSSATPYWSWNNWLATGNQSGGAVLDMHIHDVDTALWWFGAPTKIDATGLVVADLPLAIEATWHYDNGPLVFLHGSWDNNGGPFRMAFKVAMEHASILYDSALDIFQLVQSRDGKESTHDLEVDGTLAYQNEIDDFVACLAQGRRLVRITPEASRLAVETVREEMRQLGITD